MNITVLAGGDSPEREVSLTSGRCVSTALVKKGHTVKIVDPARENLCRHVIENRPDCVFIALHGGSGEGGAVQGFLETAGIPYTGSDTGASALCLNKILSKTLLAAENIPTPGFHRIDPGHGKPENPFGFPVVVKPARLGSTIGISIVREEKSLPEAVTRALSYDTLVFLERYVPGTEVTVSILGNTTPRVLPMIQIETPSGFYDYRAKYTPGGSTHRIPPALEDAVLDRIGAVSLETYRVLGCCGFARTELIVDRRGNPFVIDVNTIPGLTETSLFPDSARAAGIEFDELCETLVQLGIEKWTGRRENA